MIGLVCLRINGGVGFAFSHCQVGDDSMITKTTNSVWVLIVRVE